MKKINQINWMKFRALYFAISGIVIGVGLYSIVTWGFVIGVDFAGGTVAEYRLGGQVSSEAMTQSLESANFEVNSIQETSSSSYLIRLQTVPVEKRQEVGKALEGLSGEVEELSWESVGPSIGPELIQKTIYSLLLASGLILLWIAYQFKSIKYGVSALLAMLHDTLVLLGTFSLLGHFAGAQVDFLFVTAVLTTLSFSVHDTIVVFDRIREIKHKKGVDIKTAANLAINQTMRRSIYNSLTIFFVLVSLVVFGGSSIHWFAVALLIGTITGAYSSPFVAVPILVTWEEFGKKLKVRK
jgi:preprotein translocase subunit SecF